jgi:Lon protease-like protein
MIREFRRSRSPSYMIFEETPLFEESPFELASFSGKVRLFPLPNLVVFPHVMQPLHIFEPRYRAMLEEALASDGLIAMALLVPGWETDYEGRPPLQPAACLCRVMKWQKTPEGTYNVLLVGVRRIRIVEELPPTKLFREARVELLEDEYSLAATGERPEKQKALVEQFKSILPNLTDSAEPLQQLLSQQISLGMLTDIMGYTLELGLDLKLKLLGEASVDRRAKLLSEAAERLAGTTAKTDGRSFPPQFSLN